MEIRYLWVQSEVRSGRVVIKKIAGTTNTTDVATKHVDASTLAKCQSSSGMRTWSSTSGLLLAALMISVVGATRIDDDSSMMTATNVVFALAFLGMMEAIYLARRMLRSLFPVRVFCHASTQTHEGSLEAPLTAPAVVLTDLPVSTAVLATAPAAVPARLPTRTSYFVSGKGECVHALATCSGLGLRKTELRELRPCCTCMS